MASDAVSCTEGQSTILWRPWQHDIETPLRHGVDSLMTFRKKFAGLTLSLALLATGGSAFAAQDAEYDRIAEEMAEIRGLEVLEPLDISVQSRGELREWLLGSIENEYPEDIQERDERVLVIFGLIEPGTDVGQLQVDLLGEQVAGYYDPETAEMVVVSEGTSDEISATNEITFAHETVHALQDQHFDLMSVQGDIDALSDDEYLAVNAIIEGDATVSEIEYLIENPGLILGLQAELSDFDTSLLDDAPEFYSATLLFPYTQGSEFVTEIYEEGGWDAVNALYENVPLSTEQILHPEKYLEGEAPIDVTVNDPIPALGDEWAILDVNTFGEFIMDVFLNNGNGDISGREASEATEGWGGDEYVVVGSDDGDALYWHSEWDTEEDAREFFATLSMHEIERFGGDGEPSTGSNDGVTQFSGNDMVGEIRLDGTVVTYALAPDETILGTLIESQETDGTPAANPVASPVVATPVAETD